MPGWKQHECAVLAPSLNSCPQRSQPQRRASARYTALGGSPRSRSSSTASVAGSAAGKSAARRAAHGPSAAATARQCRHTLAGRCGGGWTMGGGCYEGCDSGGLAAGVLQRSCTRRPLTTQGAATAFGASGRERRWPHGPWGRRQRRRRRRRRRLLRRAQARAALGWTTCHAPLPHHSRPTWAATGSLSSREEVVQRRGTCSSLASLCLH